MKNVGVIGAGTMGQGIANAFATAGYNVTVCDIKIEWFKDISMVEYKRIYKMLNMDFDHYTGESFYRDKTAAVVEELKEKNLLKESVERFLTMYQDYQSVLPAGMKQKRNFR